MSLWNPFAFGVTGQARAPESPPALRVYEGTLTAAQRQAAQGVYFQFLSRARLSAAPNPTEQGLLYDGSPYRIVVVGPQATMEIWPKSGSESTPYGIGIVIADLDNKPISGFTLPDGTPQPFILTPEVVGGTRTTTGKWKVRKVPRFSGGKASFCSSTGKRMLAGIHGSGVGADQSLIPRGAVEREVGINARAYWTGNSGGGTAIFSNGMKPVGTLHGESEPVPFFYKAADGTTWLLSIVVSAAVSRTYLYGKKYTGGESAGPVGELLNYTVNAASQVLVWQSISVKPDGAQIRAMSSGPSFKPYKADASITEMGGVPQLSAWTFTGPVATEVNGTSSLVTVGDTLGGNYTSTKVYTPGYGRMVGGYGFGLTGEDQDWEVRLTTTAGREVTSQRTTGTSTDGDPPRLLRGEQWYDTSGVLTHDSLTYVLGEKSVNIAGGGTTYTTSSYNIRTLVDEANSIYVWSSTSSSHTKSTVSNAPAVIFADIPNGVVVIATSGYVREITSEGYTSGGTLLEPVSDSRTTESEVQFRLVTVWHRGGSVLTIDYTSSPTNQYAVSAAADPYTGALCFNLLEFVGESTKASRSWLYIADDTGVRPLSQLLPGLPNNAKVLSDNSLLSVV